MKSRKGWKSLALVALPILFATVQASAGAPEPVAGREASNCRVVLEVGRDGGVLFFSARCPPSSEDAAKALSENLPLLRNLGDSPSRHRSPPLGRLVDCPYDALVHLGLAPGEAPVLRPSGPNP